MAIQCLKDTMHIHPLIGIIEIVDSSGHQPPPGEDGRVIISGLQRKSMPLIRYELGDIAQSTGYRDTCECGIEWPSIGRVEGRQEDLVRTRDGRYIGYLNFHATKNLSGIKESQLVQIGYERFVMNIVIDSKEEARTKLIESRVTEQIEKRLQTKIEIVFTYLEEIPRSTRGKFKAVIVDFTEGQ